MGKITIFEIVSLDGVMQAPARPDEDTRDGFQYGGWGILGPEDLPNLPIFLLDVFFFALVLWLAGYLFQVRRRQAALNWLAVLLPLAFMMVLIAAGYLVYQPVLGR